MPETSAAQRCRDEPDYDGDVGRALRRRYGDLLDTTYVGQAARILAAQIDGTGSHHLAQLSGELMRTLPDLDLMRDDPDARLSGTVT